MSESDDARLRRRSLLAALAGTSTAALTYDTAERWFPTDPRQYASERDGETVVDGFAAVGGYTAAFEESCEPPPPDPVPRARPASSTVYSGRWRPSAALRSARPSGLTRVTEGGTDRALEALAANLQRAVERFDGLRDTLPERAAASADRRFRQARRRTDQAIVSERL